MTPSNHSQRLGMVGIPPPSRASAASMPSRKKAKGKARRAAKEAAKAVLAANQLQEGSLTYGTAKAQLQQRLELCKHGSPVLSRDEEEICLDFIDAFITAYNAAGTDVGESFHTAFEVTKAEYADVYFSDSRMKAVISVLLFCGTQDILDGDKKSACFKAQFACYFEEWTAVSQRETKAVVSWMKVFALVGADDHTLVKYYRKRIPCGCLDEKYKKVKSLKRLSPG